jgi:hypothetical protein
MVERMTVSFRRIGDGAGGGVSRSSFNATSARKI